MAQPIIQPPNIDISLLPKPKDTGRRSKLTLNVLQKLLVSFQRGHTDKEACKYAKIGESTFYEWMNHDESLRSEVEAAKDFWILAAHDKITDLLTRPGVDDRVGFQAAKFVLENKEPELYGSHAPIGSQVAAQQNNFFILNDEQLKAITKVSPFKGDTAVELLENLTAR